MYKAVSINSGTYNGQVAAQWYPNTTSTQATSIVVYRGAGAGTLQSYGGSFTTATVSVKTSDGVGTIESIFITSNADQWTSNTGSGYQVGDKLAIVADNSGICVVKINGINAVQAAILNGTLDNSVLYSLTKDAVLFDTSLNVGTGTGGVAAVGGTTFASANGIASTVPSGGASQLGAGATFDVIMNDNNTVSSIRINATATTDYVASNIVVLTQGASTISMTLSSAMVSVINGDDNAGYATFPTPLSSDGKTSNIAISQTGSGTGARVDVTMADKYNIETIANSSYSYPWTNTATSGALVTGNYTTTVLSGGASQLGAGATFRVVITAGSITSIRRAGKNPTTAYITGNVLTLTLVEGSSTITLTALDATTAAVLNGGSGYVATDVITISSGTPLQKITVTLDATTAAILNGTADALSTNGESPAGLIVSTNLPLEAGDKIRMQQGISQASGQKNTKGELVSYSQTSFIDYLLG